MTLTDKEAEMKARLVSMTANCPDHTQLTGQLGRFYDDPTLVITEGLSRRWITWELQVHAY